METITLEQLQDAVNKVSFCLDDRRTEVVNIVDLITALDPSIDPKAYPHSSHMLVEDAELTFEESAAGEEIYDLRSIIDSLDFQAEHSNPEGRVSL